MPPLCAPVRICAASSPLFLANANARDGARAALLHSMSSLLAQALAISSSARRPLQQHQRRHQHHQHHQHHQPHREKYKHIQPLTQQERPEQSDALVHAALDKATSTALLPDERAAAARVALARADEEAAAVLARAPRRPTRPAGTGIAVFSKTCTLTQPLTAAELSLPPNKRAQIIFDRVCAEWDKLDPQRKTHFRDAARKAFKSWRQDYRAYLVEFVRKMSIDNLATVDEVRKRLMKQNKKKGLAKTKVIPRAEEKGYSRKEMFCLDMMYTLQPHDPSLSMVDLDEFLDKEWMSISKHERAVFSEMYKNVKDIYSASMNRSVKCSKTEW